MEINPCVCGETVFEWSRHHREQQGDRQLSVYEGRCDRCGRARRFAFEMIGQSPPPPAYGGAAPSQIIDPSEFLAVADELAAAVPPDPATLDPADLDDAHEAIEMAVAALDEVLKFVPPGGDRVPLDAFLTDPGRATYAHDPDQFGRERLLATLSEYRQIRSAYQAALG